MFKIKNLLSFFLIVFFAITTYYILLDGLLVVNFRTTQDPITPAEPVDLTGLDTLYASGGPMVDYTFLNKKIGEFKGEKIAVDAIGIESGFVNGFPSTYFSYQLNPPEWRYYLRRFIFTGSIDIRHDLFIPEEVFATKNGFKLVKFKIGSKFVTQPDAVDEFVAFFDSLPQEAWVHFHCRGGKGRTSMMLVMYDIMRNAPNVALMDIVKRHHLLGSVDLFDTIPWFRGTYRKEALEDRKKFIEDFYTFICQKKAGGIQIWSDWIVNQGQNKA